MARERDTRRVVRGVTVHGPGGVAQVTTYAEGDEDLIEEALTPERGKELQEDGSLAGEGWKFTGKDPPVMQDSPLARAQAQGEKAVKALQERQEQDARFRALGSPEQRRRARLEARQREEGERLAAESARQADASAKEIAAAERAEAKQGGQREPPTAHTPQTAAGGHPGGHKGK